MAAINGSCAIVFRSEQEETAVNLLSTFFIKALSDVILELSDSLRMA
jgi:hypothetical protein